MKTRRGLTLPLNMRLRLGAAKAVGGATAVALTPTNVMSLFNASGSTLARPTLYAAQLSVPQRLPFAAASVVYRAMLEAIAAERVAIEARGGGTDAAALIATSDPSLRPQVGASILRRTRALLGVQLVECASEQKVRRCR